MDIIHKLNRIALIYPFFYPPFVGGIETRMFTIARELSKRKIETHIITNRITDQPNKSCSQGIYVHRIVVPVRHTWPYTSEWATQAGQAIANIVKKFEVQLIDAQDCTSLMAGFLAKAVVPSLRIIFTLHDPGLRAAHVSHSQMSFFINNLKWDAMVVPSKFSEGQAKLLADDELPIYKINNGIDTGLFVPSKNNNAIKEKLALRRNETVLLCPTRIGSDKGIIFIVRALKGINKNHATRLVISGDGAANSQGNRFYYDEIISEIKSLGLTEKVVFLNGSLEYTEMPYLYSIADVSILASTISEGFGNCIIESMSCGTPVIATRVGAIPEIIKNRRNGLLVRPKSPRMIADAVLTILNDRKLRDRLIKNGRRDATKLFSVDRMVNQLLKVYRQVVEI